VQRDEQRNARARASLPPASTVETVEPSPLQTDEYRDRRGRFAKGNPFAKTHALHAAHPPEFAEVARVDFVERALTDEGDEPPTRRRSLIEYRAVLHGQIHLLANAVERFGLFDRRGKLRTAWLSKLESLINTALSIDRLLGLDRRAKGVDGLDLDPAEYIATKQEHEQHEEARS
jgi:hypothetical protein